MVAAAGAGGAGDAAADEDAVFEFGGGNVAAAVRAAK
jgi:hypothetical protein